MPTKETLNRSAQNRLIHFEDCASAIDQLFQTARYEKGNKAFDEFLGFASRFSNLSVYNAMLVRVQRPGAAAVGSRKQWRNIHRDVLPDAIPIVILQPFGPVRFVYELGDTDGAPIPAQDQSSLFAHGYISEKQLLRTKKAAEKYLVDVLETDQYGTNLAGTAAGLSICPAKIGSNEGMAFRVKLNAKHSLPSKFATLAHELGHIYCGHLGGDSKGRWPDRRKQLGKVMAMELEAEAVAWLVCQRNGITTRSNEYLASLVDDVGLETVSMYTIFEAANRVESRTEPKKR